MTRKEKAIEELSDRALKQRVERGERVIRDIPAGASLTADERAEALRKAKVAAVDVKAGRAELDRRASAKQREEERREHLTLGAQLAVARERPQRVLTERAVLRLQRLGQDVGGLKLDPKRLSTEDLDEIFELASRTRENPNEGDRARLEQLCEQAADTSGFFDERRRKAKEARDLGQLKEAAHVAQLPRRVKYAEPGSVTLPRVVFAWLQTSRHGEWSVVEIGVLATMLSSFEEGRSLVRNAVFEEDADGERVLVYNGTRERLRFLPSVDPGLAAASTSGEVRLDAALTRLAANGWFDVRHLGRHRTEVRLGKRALELRDRV